MHALKGLVIGLGVLIVVGFMLLIYGFYARVTDPEFRVFAERGDRAAAGPEQPAATGGRGFGEVRIVLPEGCTLVEMRPDGDRLYLRTGPAGLCERVLAVDSVTGEVLGTLVARP
ncbi:MAG: hypothetical protein ACFCUO_02850 [Rhodospirillales bacterium]